MVSVVVKFKPYTIYIYQKEIKYPFITGIPCLHNLGLRHLEPLSKRTTSGGFGGRQYTSGVIRSRGAAVASQGCHGA